MTTRASKPSDLFDRDREWRNLHAFVSDPSPELLLGVVWGRRRQGKSFLLQALTESVGGVYYEAVAGTSAELLRDLGEKLGSGGIPLRIDSWEQALGALASRSPLVVLDEFPLLAAADAALPSQISRLLSPRQAARKRSRTRLILCGSALRFMVSLLSGTAPLRGRAGLEQVITPFDYRVAREFWEISDPRLAVLTYAVVGGTPAYRRELVRNDRPRSLGDFDAWVCRTALEPSSALFREGRILVDEEPTVTEVGLYHAVIAAIAAGEHAPSRIAGRIGRPMNALAHVLGVLRESGLVVQHVDAFHANRTTYEIAEPIIAFHHAIMRPTWAALERGRASDVWRRAKPVFDAKLVGPTFERLCREWTLQFASAETLGGPVERVSRGRVSDPDSREAHEVDVVALDGRTVRLLGEAKWSDVHVEPALGRLRRIRDLLGHRGFDVGGCKLALFSGAGFGRKVARRDDVALVDLERLYHGD